MLFAYHFEFMLFIIKILIFLSDFEDRKQWHNLPLFLRKIKVHKINALYLSVKVFSTEVLIGDIRQIKIHVYAKRQTWICTTWPSFAINYFHLKNK